MPLKSGFVAEIEKLIGTGRLISDPDILATYSSDETSGFSALPDAVFKAESSEEISILLGVCNKYLIPVTPRGAGSGVTGGAIPVNGGIVLSMEKLNRIIEIDAENMVAVVEPGVITATLQNLVLEKGMMYPPDPASIEICSIGGNIAEGAGGPKAVKYGTTKDYVLGLEVILPDGSIINTGGKYVKNATGYNLAGLIVGSEGTLGIVTKAYLRLIAAPSFTKDILLPFEKLDDAVAAVSTILRNRIVPSVMEFMEKDAIDLVSRHLNQTIPHPEAGAHLLIQIDGDDEDKLMSEIETISSLVNVDVEKILFADTKQLREGLWKARRSIREAIEHFSPDFFAEDCVVPRASIAAYVRDVKFYLDSNNFKSVIFGHAGDGNLHVDILRYDMPKNIWDEIIDVVKKEIYHLAIKHGGTITGEHGIGFIRKKFLNLAFEQAQMDLIKRIKAAFDPNNILNPGKIFD